MAEPTLELTIAQVEVALEEGDLAAARRLLEGARQRFGDLPHLGTLAERLAEVERLATQPTIDKLVRRSQDAVRIADYQAALEPLRQAVELRPDDARLRALLGRTEKAAQRHSVTQKRQQASAAAAREVASLLDAGDLQTARERLMHARGEHGRQKRFDQLEERLLEQVEAAQRQSAGRHLERAKDLLDRQDWRGALHQADLALTLAPGDRAASLLRARAERELEESASQEHKKTALDQVRQDVERLIAAGEMPRADDRLRQAVDALGREPLFKELAEKIDRAKKDQEFRRRIEWRERRAKEAEALVQEATRRALGGDFAAAVQRLVAAKELDPSYPEIEQKLATHRAALERHREADSQAADLERVVAAIASQLDGLRLEEAAKALRAARARFGAEARFEALGKRLDGLREAEAEVLPTPHSLPTLGLAARAAIRDRERAQAQAYSWKQAFAFPFRGHGALVWLACAVVFTVLHGLAEVAATVDLAVLGLALVIVPGVVRQTLDGKNQLQVPGGLWRGPRTLADAVLQLAILLVAASPGLALVASRHAHGALEAGAGPLGWLVVAVLLWAGSLLATVGTGVAFAFGGRQLLRPHRLPAGDPTLVAVALMLFAVVAACLLVRSTVEPEMGAPLAASIEAFAVLALPHLVGVMVRGRRLAWAERYA